MAGLADFVDETDNDETLHLMNVEYEEQYDEPVVHCYCRTKSGTRRHVEVVGHSPSFYIRAEDFNSRISNHQWVSGIDRDHASIRGEELIRIKTDLPWHVNGKKNKKGLREYFEQTWEADVYYTNQFLIDTSIKTHFTVDKEQTWEQQTYDGDYRVHVDNIEPSDPDWRATPRTITVDIEVESPNGFPEAADAEQPVTAITAYDNYGGCSSSSLSSRDSTTRGEDGSYVVWVLRYEGWAYSDTEISNMVVSNKPSTIELDDHRLPTAIDDVRVFEGESEMLHNFNQYVANRNPDLLSGWNSSATDNGDAFDYPYLVNRCKSLGVMSFDGWSPMEQVWTTRRGREQNLTMGAKGVEFFDMMQAYKKTQWQEPKGGWGLENISTSELPLDAAKLEIDDIDNAWRDAPSEFLKYNIRDVQAVEGINKAAGVIEMFQNLRSLAGVQFGDCHNNIDLLDVMILRYAQDMGVALPTNEEPDRGWYHGAHVFEPKLGRHENVVYPDLWSMYPNMIRNCNMSPETMIGTEEDLAASKYGESDCRWTYIDTRNTNIKKDSAPQYEKVYFLKPSIKTGFMTEVVDDLMEMKDHYDGTELYDAVKRVVNSVYGVYGDSDSYGKGYRLFDWRIAEGICLGGRKMIQDSSDRFVDALNEIKDERDYDGNNAYRVGGDTDSVMTSIPFMEVDTDVDGQTTVDCRKKGEMEVPKYYDDYKQIVDVAEDAAARVNEWYSEWTAETFNLTEGDHYCELEIESYGPRCFIPEGVTKKKAKKRYAEIIAWEEGEWFSPPEFSVTGIDIVRSDRAVVTREILEDVLQIILREDDRQEARKRVYNLINDVVYDIRTGEHDHSYYARPKGMSKHPSKYGSPDQLPMPTYKGAKYANEYFDWERLTAGSKPQLLYIDDVQGSWPSEYPREWETKERGDAVDAIAVEAPDEVPDDFVVDTAKMIEKTLEDPLTPILSPMRWDFDEALDMETYHEMATDEDQGSLSAFM